MRSPTIVLFLFLFLFLFGSQLTVAEPTLQQLFETELEQRGVDFVLLDDGRYELALESGKLTIYLGNLEREYQRDGDAGSVKRFVDSLLTSMAPLPPWSNAKTDVFPMIDDAGVELGDGVLARPLSDETHLALVHFDHETQVVRFLNAQDVETWGVQDAEIWNVAEAALDRIMQATTVSYLDGGGFKLGVIEAHEPHKASLIRAPSLRQKVEPELGWPIYAMAPSRGFVFLLSMSDQDQLGRIGAAVVEEFKSAEYPISTEVWEVGDDGVRAIGTFPTE